MRKFTVLLIAVLCVAFYLAGRADAAHGDLRLDTVATAVAGHPISVSCGDNSLDYAKTEQQAGLTFDTDGFTFVGRQPEIWLAPRVCDTLSALLNPAQHAQVGPLFAGLAIKVIIHESVHQRGISDEGLTDCTALGLVKQYAVSSFGYPATIKIVVYKRLKSGAYSRSVKTVPNPELAKVYAAALYWHRLLPPSYQGGC